jgi:hypothetical protein
MAKRSAQREERARAAELLALAFHIDRKRFVGLSGGIELRQALQGGLSPEVYAVAQERGRTRDVGETLLELLVELGEEGDVPKTRQDERAGLGTSP